MFFLITVTIVLSVLFFQAYAPLWRIHLQADAGVHQARAVHFLSQGSWAQLHSNEYQPGALWFFVFLSFLSGEAGSFELYLQAMVFVNLALLLLYLFFVWDYGGRHSSWVMLAFILASGPILLFRFELLVGLLVLIAWQLFMKNRWWWAAMVLGVAAAVKMYAVVLLPFFILQAMRRRVWLAGVVALAFSAGVFLPVGAYMMTGGSWDAITYSLKVHQLKPVGLDALWGSAALLGWHFGDWMVEPRTAYGVNGLGTDVLLLSAPWVSGMWLSANAILFMYVIYRFWRTGYQDYMIPFLILLMFVITGSVLNPQYLWWYASLVPSLGAHWFRQGQVVWLAGLLVLASFLTQLFYPIGYTEFADWFYLNTGNSRLFFVSLARNALLVSSLVLVLMAVERRFRSRVV